VRILARKIVLLVTCAIGWWGLLGIKKLAIFLPGFRICGNPNHSHHSYLQIHRRGAKIGGDKGFGTGVNEDSILVNKKILQTNKGQILYSLALIT
jgi:hypothetical protein